MDQVLVGVDGSEQSRRAVAFAAEEARCRAATLLAVLVVEPRHLFDDDVRSREARMEQGRAELELVVGPLLAGTDPAVEQRVVMGDPRRVLRELAGEADQVVVGARGTGRAEGPLLGSVSRYVVTHAASPVTVTRATADRDGPVERIVVGVDGSATSLRAVEWACEVARCRGAALTATIVAPPTRRYDSWQDPAVEEAAAQLRTTIEAAAGDDSVHVEREIQTGDPREVLEQLSREADLLVVGTRGHGRVAGLLLGSVSQHLVAHAACHVTVVPAPA